MSSAIKNWIKIAGCVLARFSQRLFFWAPTVRGRVLFDPYVHPGFGGNPKYVALWLVRNHPGAYDLIWVAEDPSTCRDAREAGLRVIRRKSRAHWWAHFTAETVVYSDMLYLPLARRRKQTYIQVWHGAINYKRIGLSALTFLDAPSRTLFRLQNPPPDFFVSGSAFFTEDTAASFGFSRDIFLSSGLPRNDALLTWPDTLKEKVHVSFGLSPATRIVLYAPTFRMDCDVKDHALDAARLRDALTSRFGGDWTLMIRQHGFVAPGSETEGSLWLDVSSYPDMQELLCAADALISDYSSCMWDYSFLNRPILAYAPDMDEYIRADRGFAFPPDRWPYPIVQDNDALEAAILTFDTHAFRQAIQAHHRDAGAYDKGHACADVGAVVMGRGVRDQTRKE